jgi:threonine/homoserine/homoserine lactone efflux protein
MDLDNWLIYAVAAIGLSLTPGPNGLLVLTHGAIYGRRRTVNTILGGSVGFVVIIGLSIFGIGALLAASSELLVWLKFVGGAYLIWLGIRTWRSPSLASVELGDSKSVSNWGMFSQGALSALTNPKGILFFVAFLPQFIDPGQSLLLQFVIMAATFAVIEFIYEWGVAALASKVQGFLAKAGRTFNRVTGGIFMAIGVLLPLRG